MAGAGDLLPPSNPACSIYFPGWESICGDELDPVTFTGSPDPSPYLPQPENPTPPPEPEPGDPEPPAPELDPVTIYGGLPATPLPLPPAPKPTPAPPMTPAPQPITPANEPLFDPGGVPSNPTPWRKSPWYRPTKLPAKILSILSRASLFWTALLFTGGVGPPGRGELYPNMRIAGAGDDDRTRRSVDRAASTSRSYAASPDLAEVLVSARAPGYGLRPYYSADRSTLDLPWVAASPFERLGAYPDDLGAPAARPIPRAEPVPSSERQPISSPQLGPQLFESPLPAPLPSPEPYYVPRVDPNPDADPLRNPYPTQNPFADPLPPPAPSRPGNPGPSKPPLTRPKDDPLGFLQPLQPLGPIPQEELDRCNCRKQGKKERKPKEPRTRCFKGEYFEKAKSLSKSPKEEIPCQ